MTENEVAKVVVDACYRVHTALGPGLLESVYQRVLAHEIQKRGLATAQQVIVPIVYDGITIDEGFRADIIVEGCVILELKSIEKIAPVHKKQLLTYLRLTGMRLGLLVNFGDQLMREGISRVINGELK